MTAVLAGLGTAFPPAVGQDELWRGFFAGRYRHGRAARLIFEHSGVRYRHAVVNPVLEDISGWGTERRMRRYLAESVPLGRAAVAAALADAGLAPAELGLLAVVSCTGYATPGVDVGLARELDLPAGMRRLLIGHMGCHAALPGLSTVADFVAARRRPALLLSVELTSLHIQPPVNGSTPDGLDQVVTHALFSDAAAAVVVRPDGPPGFEVLDVLTAADHRNADQMTWHITDRGFRMGLSSRVPRSLAEHLPGLVGELLGRHGLRVPDVAGWAVHPGGPSILDAVQRELRLPAAALAASRETLDRHGNCSSATVLMVLRRLLDARPPSGAHLVALAFGPGLTLYAVLLRAR